MCRRQFSDGEASVAADLEDVLLAMEHDASHAFFISWSGYLWFAGLVYLVWEGYVNFAPEVWHTDPETQLVFLVSTALQPVFLIVIAVLITRWHTSYRRVWSQHTRGLAARQDIHKATLNLVVSTLMYAVMAVGPTLVIWFGTTPPSIAP